MLAFQNITSQVLPLNIKDVDTDMIIPATFLTSISEGGYGKNVFRRLRDQDANFPMNLEKYRTAQIIVAQDNFGCGSSREHAVWALLEHGIRVIIAPSFADIFNSNSAKNGLVLVQLPEVVVQRIMKEAEDNENYQLSVDLEKQTVGSWSFEFDSFRKDCILKGHDDLDYLVDHMKDIESWQQQREKKLWYSTLHPNNP